MLLTVLALVLTSLIGRINAKAWINPHPHQYPIDRECIVTPSNGGDDAPNIINAFNECGHNPPGQRGKVVFLNETYHIKSVMITTYLTNVDIDHRGTLLWDTNIDYWLNNSLPMGYQNQSTAWQFGGDNLHWYGHGYGTLNGNGQVWYDFINGTSNYPRRPHQITVRNTTNSIIEGLNFLQSQMWTMTVISSENVLLRDIYVNNTSSTPVSTSNTDGCDTIYANNITFVRWTITNGDDSISQKANSTNIHISNCTFHNGLGVAIGSIGQYNDTFEYIENVTAKDIVTYGTKYVAYVKTWTGVAKGYPPNGGGGGIGYASNLHFSNFTTHNNTGIFAITQCTSYNGATGGCDTSLFNIHNISLTGVSGTVADTDVVAVLQCSAASPCRGVSIEGVRLTDMVNGTVPAEYLCDSVVAPQGFGCTGPVGGQNSD